MLEKKNKTVHNIDCLMLCTHTVKFVCQLKLMLILNFTQM